MATGSRSGAKGRGGRAGARGGRQDAARGASAGGHAAVRASGAHGQSSRKPDFRTGNRKAGVDAPESGRDLEAAALASVLSLDAPADRRLTSFLRAHPEMGRRDRARAADTVFDVLRNLRLYEHLARAAPAGPAVRWLIQVSHGRRGLLHGAVPSWLERWLPWPDDVPSPDGVPSLSASPSSDSSDRVEGSDPVATLPFEVRYSLPNWLTPAIHASPRPHELAAALLEPAPLDLRVNLLRGNREAAIAHLAEDGILAHPLPLSPWALRVEGKPALETSSAFREGLVEVQDAGSQLLALLAGVRRGQTVIDFCAGAGGKTLALASAMRGTGQVFACDISARRLGALRERVARSGATNVQPMLLASEHDPKLARLRSSADVVLVDAPCSGSGTVRRNPDLKWRNDAQSVERLVQQQRSILAAAAELVKPGGLLIYATCSLLRVENERQATGFEADCPDFVREDTVTVLEGLGAVIPASGGAGLSAAASGSEDAHSHINPAASYADQALREAESGSARPERFLRLYPHLHGCDAYFAARWRLPRKAPATIAKVTTPDPVVTSAD